LYALRDDFLSDTRTFAWFAASKIPARDELMVRTFAFSEKEVAKKREEEDSCSADWPCRRGLIAALVPAAAILLGLGSSAKAQAIPWTSEEFASPWNAQRIFEPSSLTDLTDPDSREEVAPEDMPVKKRQQPGYETRRDPRRILDV